MQQSLEQRIRARAYEIWHSKGCAEGNAEEHWLAAEREVLSFENAVVTTAQTSPPSAVSETVLPRKEKRRRGVRRRAN